MEEELRDKIIKKLSPLIQMIFLSTGVLYGTIFFRLEEKADTYFVMNLGRYILENGFPHVDPFTIHENLQLVPQQWLSGVFFWEIYKFLGADGLRLADFIVGTISVLIFWRLCLLVSGGDKYLSLVLSFFVGVSCSNWFVPRPHIISTLIFLIEIFLLERFTLTKNFKLLLPLPILSMLLINFHASMWLMLLVLCLPFLFVKNSRHIKFLLAAMAAIFLFGFVNPYGLDAMTYVFRSYGIDLINQGIKEMMTPSAHDLRGKLFYLSAAFVIFSLAKFKVPLRYIFLSGGIIYMTIMHGRNLILFYFLATFPLAYTWKNQNLENFFIKSLFFILLSANIFLIVKILKYGFGQIIFPLKILFISELLFLIYNLLIARVGSSILHSTMLPKKNLSLFLTALVFGGIFFTTLDNNKKESDETYGSAMKFLLKNERPENISLYVNQGYGGLAGSLGIKYYIDSRSEVFLPANNGQKNIFEEYHDFRRGKISYEDFFSRYNFTHIITDSGDYFLYDELSRDKNFRVIYESEHLKGYEVVRCRIFVPKNGV